MLRQKAVLALSELRLFTGQTVHIIKFSLLALEIFLSS